MFCPECHSEYRHGFTTCADCGVDLVREFPPDDDSEARIKLALEQSKNPDIYTIICEQQDLEATLAVLDDSGIPHTKSSATWRCPASATAKP